MKNGFSLVEMMIVVSIIGIMVAVAIPSYENYLASKQFDQKKFHRLPGGGKVFVDCLEGYKFLVAKNGVPQQIFNEEKKGIRCEK